MRHSTAAPADDNRDPFDCACRETWDGDPAELCDACRWDYDCWCDRQAAEAEQLDLYCAAPAGWTLEALAPLPN
jgi:hypothetical protein